MGFNLHLIYATEKLPFFKGLGLMQNFEVRADRDGRFGLFISPTERLPRTWGPPLAPVSE